MFRVNNKDTRTTPSLFLIKLQAIRPLETLRRSGVFIVNSENISHLVLVFLFLTFDM